ncbi:hypothetical protein D3C85_1260390 [compost metagenome]
MPILADRLQREDLRLDLVAQVQHQAYGVAVELAGARGLDEGVGALDLLVDVLQDASQLHAFQVDHQPVRLGEAEVLVADGFAGLDGDAGVGRRRPHPYRHDLAAAGEADAADAQEKGGRGGADQLAAVGVARRERHWCPVSLKA